MRHDGPLRGPVVDCRSTRERTVKRLISMTVGLALGITLWSGPAWAEGEPTEGATIVSAEQSHDSQNNAGDPITPVFSEVQSTLNRIGFSNPLRSLLNTIAAQLATLQLQLAQLYDDLFVETCPTCDSMNSV